jgi:hypothetical protein
MTRIVPAGNRGIRSFPTPVRSAWHWLRDRWRAAAERRRLTAEFAGLQDADADRVFAETGFSRAELEDLIRGAPEARPLLDAMAARLGVAPMLAAAGPETIRDIERRCTTCHVQRRCRRWLRHGKDADGYRRFCPNAAMFDLFAAAKRRSDP